MKIINIINIKLLISTLLILASSCSNDELPVYEDVDRVYFYYSTAATSEQVDNAMINMGYDKPVKSDSIIEVAVRLMGKLSDTDRPVTAEIIRTESTAAPGEDIEFLPSVIPAGKETGNLIVKIKNTERLKTQVLQARIRLTPNEFFHTDLNAIKGPLTLTGSTETWATLEYSVLFTSISDRPELWTSDSNTLLLVRYFGSWSKVKEDLLCELFGVTRDFFMFPEDYDGARDTAGINKVVDSRITPESSYGLISMVNRYLQAYKDEHDGEPLLDENGKEVKMSLTIM